MENLIAIGYTQKPHGLKGELKFFVEENFEDDFFGTEAIFIEVKGTRVPYFMESVRSGNQIIVKLEGVDTKEAAQMLSSKSVLLSEKSIVSGNFLPDSDLLYSDCVGFLVEDVEFGVIGVTKEILEMPQQEMAIVEYKNKEIMIPLHPKLIEKVDYELKKIIINLPNGLLDL